MTVLVLFSAVIAQMLQRIPAATIVWRTMSHPFTAGEMASLLQARDERSLQWVTDFLRVYRDISACRAKERIVAPEPDSEALAVAGTISLVPFKALLAELGPGDPAVLWSAASGEVLRSQMVQSLEASGDVAKTYVAHFVQAYREVLAQYQADPSRGESAKV